MRSRSLRAPFILAGMALAGASATLSSQQATDAQLQSKTAGLVRALGSPGALDAPIPGATTPAEQALADVGESARGDVLPKLELFVQYANGAPAQTGAVVPATPQSVRQLAANDAVRAIELLRPPSFDFEEMRPFNRNARLTHRVPEFNSRFPMFTGASRLAVVVDAGAVRSSHQEFQAQGGGSRVRIATKRPHHTHATHVAGTIIASGVDDRARGMAPAAAVLSLDFLRDFESIAAVAAASVAVSNHSYGPRSGWSYSDSDGWLWWGDRSLSEDEDVTFGRYGARESTFDQILSDPSRSQWLAFVAAGNDRNDAPRTQPVAHRVWTLVNGRLDWQYSQRTRPADGGTSGTDTVGGLCVSKNVVCIGAIEDATNANPPFQTTVFSAWGPADDGRVKPDLVANGQNLLSTSDANDRAYLEMPGTSMASPTAAGIAVLIGQAFEHHRGRPATAVDVKAALIHSATDAGRPGPDAEFGWGVINALEAGELVAGTGAHLFETVTLQAGGDTTWSLRELPAESGTPVPIRVTMVWNDPPGRANVGPVDDRTPALQNDLDIELIGPNGAKYFPYRLNVGSPLANAQRDGANRVDNVEVIDAPASSGQWRLRIRAFQLNQGTSQQATIVTSGLQR